MKKILLLSAAVITFTAALAWGVTGAKANGGQYPAIIDKLVAKFGLNRDEVQAVFDENRQEQQQERQQEMQTKIEERLTAAVTAGELTEEQKKLILEKLAEQKESKPDLTGNTREEMKQEMEAHRQELETWAKEKGIDMKYLGFGGGPVGEFGGRGPQSGWRK